MLGARTRQPPFLDSLRLKVVRGSTTGGAEAGYAAKFIADLRDGEESVGVWVRVIDMGVCLFSWGWYNDVGWVG